MSPKISLKLKSLMMIAMLAVAAGSRVRTNRHLHDALHDALNSRSASSSHGAGKRDDHRAPEAPLAPLEAPLELDLVLKDPAVLKQLVAMSGHLETSALELDMLLKDPAAHKRLEAITGHLESFALELDMVRKDPAVHKQLESMTGHLKAFALEWGTLRKDSAVPKQLEAMTVQLKTLSLVLDMLLEDPAVHKQLDAMTGYSERFALELDMLLEYPEVHKRLDVMTGHFETFALELDMLLEDPAVHKQLEAMTGHLESFALELDMLLGDPAVHKQLEAMTRHLKTFAIELDMVRKNPAVHKQLEAMTGHLETFALELDMLHKDPAVQEQLEAMTGHLETFALELDMVRKDPAVHQLLEAMTGHSKAFAHEVDMLRKNPAVHKQVEAITGLLEMFPDQMKAQTLLEDMDLDQLAGAIESPGPELEEDSAEVRSAIDPAPPSLVQMSQSSEQESSKPVPIKTLAALMMLVSPGLAYSGAQVRAPARPDGLSAAAHIGPSLWRQSVIVAMAAADPPRGPSEDLEDPARRVISGTSISLGATTAEEAPAGQFLPPALPPCVCAGLCFATVCTRCAGLCACVRGQLLPLVLPPPGRVLQPVPPSRPPRRPMQMPPLSLVEPTPSAKAAVSWTARINRVSTYASILCAIDCTVLPLLLILMPFADGSVMLHKVAHLCSLYFVLPIGGTALTANFVQHRNRLLGLQGLSGWLLILLANIHLREGLLPHSFAHMLHERHELVNVLGCALLLSSQWASTKALQGWGKAWLLRPPGKRPPGMKALANAAKTLAEAWKSLAQSLKS